MEGLGATVDERDIGSGTVLLMIRTGFAGGNLARVSVPEVRAAEKETEPVNSRFCDAFARRSRRRVVP
jgi:hypothetical protein